MECSKLRTEYQINPIGIDIAQPRFSWQVLSDKRDVMQTGYRIQFSKTPDFSDIFHDTDFVSGSRSSQIEYVGPELTPFQRLYWRVMVNTTQGDSPFSNPAFFETGLMDAKWEGRFIEPAEKFVAESPCPVLKRKFNLKEKPQSARLYITALGMYQAYINETGVDQDILAPGWTSYNNHIQYQTYDVTDMLGCGENILSVILGSGWYMGRFDGSEAKNHYGDRGALLAQLKVTYEDGSEQTIATDETWRSSTSAIVFSEIYDGEIYDNRKAGGLGAEQYESLKNAVLHEPKNRFRIEGQNTPGVRVIDEICPIEVITTPKGDTVVDFGQNMVGWVSVTAKGKTGDEIHLFHGEILNDGEFYNANLSHAKAEATYILNGEDPETFEPHFTFFGFRYVKVDKYPGEVKLENFKGIVISSNIEYGGRFECANENVNRLFQNILWGQKGNFLDVPTDCPQRDERLGWTGDTQVFSSAACCNSLVAPFYAKWLKDLAYDQMESGAVPDVVPDLRHDGQTSSAWGDAATIVPNLLYEVYGDKRLLKGQYPSMKKWVEFIRENSENETIWATERHYGDWLAKEDPGIRTPKPLISTVFYYNSVNILAKAAKILGYGKDAIEYEILSEKIRKAFNREFVTDSGHVSGETQTAYTLALYFGLLDKRIELIAAGHLAELVRKKKHRITTGFVGTPYITHVLSVHGYNEDAYKMLLNEECPGWLYPVKLGATTIWERWDAVLPDGRINPSGMNSFNHYAYGSIGHWLYAKVLGIEPIDGYSLFSIAPKPSRQLAWAKGGFETLYGRIEVEWKLEGDKINMQIRVPCNTRANVCLPFAKLDDIRFEGKASQSGEDVSIFLGSGNYAFSYVYNDF